MVLFKYHISTSYKHDMIQVAQTDTCGKLGTHDNFFF